MFRLSVCLLLALGSTGCASSHLKVSIDLYDEDPRFTAPMSPEEAFRLQQDIEALRQAALDRTSQRKFLAAASRNIFVDTWTKAQGDEAVSAQVDAAYLTYLTSSDLALKNLQPALDEAATQVNTYLASYQTAYATAADDFQQCENYRVSGRYLESGHKSLPKECHVSELGKRVERLDNEWILRRLPVSLRAEEATVRMKVGAAAGAYRSFASSTATIQTASDASRTSSLGPDTPRSHDRFKGQYSPVTATDAFVIDWMSLRSKLNLMIEAAQLGGLRERYARLTLAIQSFNAQMASLAAAMKLIPKEEVATQVAREAIRTPSGLLDSSVAIALELDTLRTNLPDNASAQTALAGLARNSSEFVEIIDRLQDTGNPVWRIITDPANEEHWNKNPANTEFYAEGKSSVVFVRNDPMRFDVHDATNNPTALIKGQLEISRAVANAAISVASASAGIPVPKSSAGAATGANTSPAPSSGSDAATAFATRKATADEAAQLRDRQIRGLELELSSTLAAISSGPDPVPASQTARLDALLKAYKALFDASAKSSP